MIALGPAARLRLLAALVLAGMLTGFGSAGAEAASCQSWSGVQPLNPGTAENTLFGTAVFSPCDVWVAGISFSGGANQALILRWNGRTWRQAASPNLGSAGSDNSLSGVAATSAGNAWAVGGFIGAIRQALAIHCC